MQSVMISSRIRVRIFSVIVTAYMVAALAWWGILLSQKTTKIYELQTALGDLFEDPKAEFTMQQWMIGSEAIVFAVSLILGIILINNAFKREMIAAKQQKNFLLSVTHELKSPITALQLILDTFKRRNLTDAQLERLITDGQEEAARLNKLVEDLLTAARLSPKSTLARANVEVWKTIEPLISQYEKKYHNIDFKVEKKDHNYLCSTNEPSLCLIVSNLLDNAVKYSLENPKITITIAKSNASINLAVADHGSGIPDLEKKRVFDQFYRMGDEEVRMTKGTGLGLFLVKELCTKLDIKIVVRDNQPKGSIFELSIPVNK